MATNVELYTTGVDPTMPLTNDPDADFAGDFDTVEQAAEWADCNGCGWYLWSTPDRGKYLGSIRVVQGSPPEIAEF